MICVTGGAGFLGSRVIAELLARHHTLRCAVRSAARGEDILRNVPADARSRIEIAAGRLDDTAFCASLLAGCTAVVHAAAPLTGSVPALFAGGVVPTRVLVNAAIECDIRRFVLVSSLGVYGAQDLRRGAVLDERCPVDRQPHRRDPYTYSKVMQERVCWDAHNGRALPLVVIRPGVLYGPGRPLVTARVGLTLGRVLIQMGGRRRLPYCFVDNCARAIASAVDARGIDGMSFNIVDDDLPSANRVVDLHRRQAGIRRVMVPGCAVGAVAAAYEVCAARSAGMIPPIVTRYKAAALWQNLRFSNALAKAHLDWQPTVTFEEGARRTIELASISGDGR